MQRRTVTILFCDVTGSTALGESVDPEALRGLLARYFERMKSIVEHHGGTVEKFIGDAVMAVFGVPTAHEDDALRAIRAAEDMLQALPELGVQARIGVNTGEVVTGTEERLATGDAVNVAARLEQAAAPGEVLLGEPTLVLVRGAAEVEPVEPLTLKGKAEPVAAYRLVGVHDAPERSHAARFVGRHGELAVLRAAYERVRDEGRCELVTIVGDAGVGKSRVVAEALRVLDARTVRARCLPYGEGITYWPVVEVLKQLRLLPPDESAAVAIRSLLGETAANVSSEEIAWAFRKTLEHAAAERPLVVVFDDIHWGEETFLDLIEHAALLSSGAPVLIVCMARPALTERRPTWPVTFRLEPLGTDDVDALIPHGLADELRAKIAHAAGGNPLFVEEMLAIADESDGDIVVPPTLQALLAARLDQLETVERTVLERAAVEGEIFHRGAVQALAPGELQVTPRLAALVRKELIRPDRTQLADEDGFRFRHLLIRDTAYDGLAKATRAELHERFAAWLEEHGSTLVELDEIVGYHVEQACLYRSELGLPADPDLATTARRHLVAAARRADTRGDMSAAAGLFERAAGLVPAGELDLTLELETINALYWPGRGEDAARRAESLAAWGAATGDRVAELCGRLEVALVGLRRDPKANPTERLAELADEGLTVCTEAGNDAALALAYVARGQVANMRARMDDLADAYELAATHARRAGLANDYLAWRQGGRFWGTTPLSELLVWEDGHGAMRSGWARGRRAEALAMLGRFDEARALLTELRAELAERGNALALASATAQHGVHMELLANEAAAAVELGEEGCKILADLGEDALLSTTGAKLAEALYELDRLDEADAWTRRSEQLGASDDLLTQVLWRVTRAKVLARRGERGEAERLAREAVALADTTQMLDTQADTYAALAEVLRVAGREHEAGKAYADALTRYERKGNVVRAAWVRERLDAPAATDS